MTETVDGYEREEIDLGMAALWYETLFRKDGAERVVRIDRILVDRFGDDWRRRMELLILRNPNRENPHFIGQFVAPPTGDPR